MLKCSKTGNFGKFKYEIGVTHTRADLRNTLGIGGARRAWKDTWYKVDQVKSESCIIDGPSTQEILALKAISARYGKFVSLDFWRIIAFCRKPVEAVHYGSLIARNIGTDLSRRVF